MSEKDINTANKIKEAAGTLFTEKGFGRTTTREIATAAGVNLALVNYHFRSKDELFKAVMMETVESFVKQLRVLLNNEKSFDEKLDEVVNNYIDLLLVRPDLPIFMLSELRNNPEDMTSKLKLHELFGESSFFRELFQRAPEGIHPIQIFINMLSMTVFPFLAKPLLSAAAGLEEDQFKLTMDARRKLIPLWIKSMLNPANE
ncbi:MAG TPA: TetR family transcriptional regulator [Flavobacteriales bacterium]|nr:TetR family transcriptional regulator [Flavobacteriales bacterium]